MRECFGPAHLRTRDWRTIWSHKDRLPRGSQYKAALAMDDDLADRLLAREDEEDYNPDDGVTPEGYSTDTYLLLSVIDALLGVQAAIIAAAGADPPSMHPMPRPITALDAARERKRRRSMEKLVADFTRSTGIATE